MAKIETAILGSFFISPLPNGKGQYEIYICLAENRCGLSDSRVWNWRITYENF